MEKKIKIAVIGNGGRAQYVVNRLIIDSKKGVEIISVYDPDEQESERSLRMWKSENAKICSSFRDAIDMPGVEWVMVFSPNAYHKEHILYSFSAGKHVFAEKPLATKINDCSEIYTAHKNSGKFFATGFVLRYAPLYRKAKEILDSGKIGKIISIDANENIKPAHGGYIMMNWRRFTSEAGPHILEKCCHDLDLINWFCESIPTRVASFGGLNFFIPENEKLTKRNGRNIFKEWRDPHGADSPFMSEKDIMDNQVGILEYRNGIRVMFQATMSNAIPERRMYFSCTEGTMRLELYSGILEYKILGENELRKVELAGGGHGGGDSYIMQELFKTMTEGVSPRCSGEEGLKSAVTSLALDLAAKEGRIVDLESIWQSLNH